ncbi:glycosyltransferase family 32 protein [Xylariomycetidae sp. FL0641]|nr:glycosyltransferase family 32 protein [Xylariomycetidae sp. FL0641]
MAYQVPLIRFRRLYYLPLLCFLVFSLPYTWPFLRTTGARLRQTHPWSYQWQVQQPFVATQDELDCLYGRTPSASTDTSSETNPIPNHVHFIYGLSNPYYQTSVGTFDFLCYLAVRSAIVGLKADRVFLHYTYLADPPAPEPNASPWSNPWISRLKDDITLEYHSPEEMAALKSSPGATWQAAHISDILRLKLLQERGGIYLDMDSFGLRPFTDLLKSRRDMIMGHEGGDRGGLCNAIMVARRNSSFIDRWLTEYNNVDLSREWNYHSVRVPKQLQLQYRNEVCALPPSSFFWPTWTWYHIEWMHQPLSKEEADIWTAQIKENGGSLFGDQLAYHAWSQMAWDRYLKHLSPEVVRNHDTRFTLLMRNFLQDDL